MNRFLTLDILLDLLAEWPRGFSFCGGEKQAPASVSGNIYAEREQFHESTLTTSQ